ncbi:MAG TPA: PP2C family serine/threonine-protein phosphatase, partial [Ktedonobacteraceae bacterium]|nr:PP2C family serine/threonine-protein phosphatase [Ktedonobacteraceae bacterium]
LVPGNAVTEQPTVEMAGGSGSGINNKNSSGNAGGGFIDEPTVHYALQQLQGKHLGFVAGTRSDPGIKRKYRPNEDSLFAAQGLINNSTQPPVFGLFVVADGMGGHAQGEDASQLAIQTIINSVLPAVSKSNSPTREGYAQLLVEGIQQANQAVHQHNIEQHGDMGTTVTAALVVDTFAYVANVGDSRTYLYRPAEGLKKITTDHSVVASLVEAGIIKPDDIYTHPKRNQIYRSLGEKPAVEIDSFTVQLQEGDKLLLCSDGLWDMVRDPRIEELIKSPAPDPTATGDALIQEALASGGEDNVSVIVVHITEAARSAGLPRIQLLAKPDSVHMPQM